MRALTFQAPGEVAVSDVPEPTISNPDQALVAVRTAALCGSDLHIYHGRVFVEQGFVIGHELVGEVVAVGDQVRRVAVGDRVVSCFRSACGSCFFCLRGQYQHCEQGRTFGHGKFLGDLQGAQAELVVVPNADITLRKVPEGIEDGVAIFAGDVLGTAYHAIVEGGLQGGERVAVVGLGPVGLCAVQVAVALGAAEVFAIDSVQQRLELAGRFGARPVELGEGTAEVVREATEGRGADLVVEAVGSLPALQLAISLARMGGRLSVVGVHAEPGEVHVGLVWFKGLRLNLGLANVIAHVDPVLALLAAGKVDPKPLITHTFNLAQAPDAYRLFDRREALKVLLTP
jgi:threonine dehydrogenase-like Zn-dependent dehydrogenase